MPYDEKLADRVRHALGRRTGIIEKKMFGGLAFLSGGKMFCGILNDELMVRVGPERYADALERPHVRPMDFTGHAMNGYVFVGAAGCARQKMVGTWVDSGAEFVATLEGTATSRRRVVKPKR